MRFVYLYEFQNPGLLTLPILKFASQADLSVKDKRLIIFKEYFALFIFLVSIYTLKKNKVSYIKHRKY